MLWLETTLFTTRNHNGSHITSNCLLGSKVQIYILILGQGTGGRGQGAGDMGVWYTQQNIVEGHQRRKKGNDKDRKHCAKSIVNIFTWRKQQTNKRSPFGKW